MPIVLVARIGRLYRVLHAAPMDEIVADEVAPRRVVRNLRVRRRVVRRLLHCVVGFAVLKKRIAVGCREWP